MIGRASSEVVLEATLSEPRFGVDYDFLLYRGRVGRHSNIPKTFAIDPYFDVKNFSNFVDFDNLKYQQPNYSIEDAYKVFGRYDKCFNDVDEDIWSKAVDWGCRHFGHIFKPVFWDHDEVIHNMDHSTSVGFPYNKLYHNKGDLLESLGSTFLIDQFEDWRVNHWPSLWSYNYKDELRPTGKAHRGIVCAPIDKLYIGMRLFGAQNKEFYSSYLVTSSAVGIPNTKGGWNMLHQKLGVFPKHAWDTDVGKFDSCLMERFARGSESIRTCSWPDYIKRKWERDIRAYYDECLRTLILLPDGAVYQKFNSNPSGGCNTTVDNTLANYLLLAYCFIKLNPGATYADFCRWVRLILYGDDNGCTYDAENVNYSSEAVCRIIESDFRMETTGSGDVELKDLTFLGAKFGDHNGIKVPIYDPVKMAHSAVFTGHKDGPEISYQRLCCLRALNIFDQDFVDACDKSLDELEESGLISHQDTLNRKNSIYIKNYYVDYRLNFEASGSKILQCKNGFDEMNAHLKVMQSPAHITSSLKPKKPKKPRNRNNKSTNLPPFFIEYMGQLYIRHTVHNNDNVVMLGKKPNNGNQRRGRRRARPKQELQANCGLVPEIEECDLVVCDLSNKIPILQTSFNGCPYYDCNAWDNPSDNIPTWSRHTHQNGKIKKRFSHSFKSLQAKKNNFKPEVLKELIVEIGGVHIFREAPILRDPPEIVQVLQSRRSGNREKASLAGLTQDGSNWFIEALDTFHDKEIGHRGYPDMNSCKTVIQEGRVQVNVSAPASAAGGNWDVLICNLNEAYTSTDPTGSGYFNMIDGLVTLNGTTYGVSPFIISSNIEGGWLLPGDGSFGTAVFQNVNFNQYFANDDPCRVVSMGFEVHNTTAEISKQGTVTAFKVPQVNSLGNWNIVRGGPVLDYDVFNSVMPPALVNQAMPLAGTRQWLASEGALVNCVMNNTDMPFVQPNNFPHAFSDTSNTNQPGSNPGYGFGSFSFTSPSAFVTKAVTMPIPYDTSGVFLTGLSNASTLTITFKMLIEIAPSWNSPFVSLGAPSAAYDPLALQLYANVIREIPPAVKVNENASGDWFRGIMGIVQTVAPVFGPVGALIGSAAGNLAAASKGIGNKTTFIPNGKRVPMNIKQ